MKEVCKNCIHCHKAKELVNMDWVHHYICTLWLDVGEKGEPLLQVLNNPKNELCECFEQVNNDLCEE